MTGKRMAQHMGVNVLMHASLAALQFQACLDVSDTDSLTPIAGKKGEACVFVGGGIRSHGQPFIDRFKGSAADRHGACLIAFTGYG